MKIVDDMADFILLNLNMGDTLDEMFPGWRNGPVLCPVHTDTKPSLSISAEGKAKCHGCGWYATNIIDLNAKMNEVPYAEMRKLLYERAAQPLKASVVATREKALAKAPDALAYLKKRGLPPTTIADAHIGYESHVERITIPIYDQFGGVVNIRRFAFDGRPDRVLNVKGKGEARVYPEQKMIHEPVIMLVEGEWDALIGRSFGLPTVTWTGGASTWNDKYNYLFKDKGVIVCYDNDAAGIKGGAAAEAQLKKYAKAVKKLEPPKGVKGKDLTDWLMVCPRLVESYRLLIREMEESLEGIHDQIICPYCKQEMPK